KEFTPEEEEEDEKGKKKGKQQKVKRKGIIGGTHLTSQTQIVCVGEWAYPVEVPTVPVVEPKKEAKAPRKASAAELERLKKLGFEVAGEDGTLSCNITTIPDSIHAEDDDYPNEDDDDENSDRVAEKILKKRTIKGKIVEYLVQWKGMPESK